MLCNSIAKNLSKPLNVTIEARIIFQITEATAIKQLEEYFIRLNSSCADQDLIETVVKGIYFCVKKENQDLDLFISHDIVADNDSYIWKLTFINTKNNGSFKMDEFRMLEYLEELISEWEKKLYEIIGDPNEH